MQNSEFTSKVDKQTEILNEINEQLKAISEDQKFIGESVHSIRVWIIISVISAIIALFF